MIGERKFERLGQPAGIEPVQVAAILKKVVEKFSIKVERH